MPVQYLAAWAAVTPSKDVQAPSSTPSPCARPSTAWRSPSASTSSASRSIPKEDPKNAERMAIAGSTALSDKEKFEALGLGRRPQNGTSDVFDNFFENKDLDPVTGGLLGRYVAEERDSGRKFAECYGLLCAEADKAAAKSNGAKSQGQGARRKKK